MTELMRAIVWDGSNYPEGLTFQDVSKPKPGSGWVLVHNKACGICGSDLHFLNGQNRNLIPDRNLPAVLGHENAGVVVELGENVSSVKVGDRVAVEPLHGCIDFGEGCPMCRVGKYHICQRGKSHVGIPLVRMLPGGYGEYSIVHENHLFPITEGLSFEETALLDVLACNVHAVKLARPSMGDSAVVLGCGIIGLDMIQCLRVEGVSEIIAVAKYSFQADAAREMGAKEVVLLEPGLDPVEEVDRITGGCGVDQVYECVGGESDAINQSIYMCRKGGSVIMIGVFSGQRPVDLRTMMGKEVHILTSCAYSTAGFAREYQIGMDLLADGSVDHKKLITHRFYPEDYRQAFDVAMSKGEHSSIKTVFVRA